MSLFLACLLLSAPERVEIGADLHNADGIEIDPAAKPAFVNRIDLRVRISFIAAPATYILGCAAR